MNNDLSALLVRGMSPFFSASPTEIIAETIKHIAAKGVFVGYEKDLPVAFCIVHWPQNALETPQVLHFYSEGPRSTTQKLVGLVLDKVRQRGYTKLRAINGSSASDEVWKRIFHHDDWEIKPVKTVFEFEVKK